MTGESAPGFEWSQLRAYFSVIFQDYALYHFSAADNIGFGRVGEIEDRPRIEQYEAVLGRFIERGQELSGGQRQLLALARALMREAPVLILWEILKRYSLLANKPVYSSVFHANVVNLTDGFNRL